MVEPVRVALVHRYFDPDMTTYGEMLDRFARHLASLGHEVTIVTTQPSYNQTYDGPARQRSEVRGDVVVRRLVIPGIRGSRGKTIGSLLFPFVAASHLLARRHAYDVVSVSTMPPVVMGLAGRVAKLRSRRARLVYHCMDLYPEVAVAMGMLRRRGIVRLAEMLDRSTMRVCDRVIVLSDDMERTLARRGVTDRVAVCNNFILEPAGQAAASSRPEGPFRVVFAGNLGRFQAIDTLLDAARRVGRSRADFELVFMGAGAMAETIRAASADGVPVRLEPFRPLGEAMEYVASADAAVVSLAPGVLDAAFPSKLMTYLEVGVPVIAVCEADSSLAVMVRDHGLGVVAPNDDPVALADALVELIDAERPDPMHLRRVGRDHFDTDRVLDRWTELYSLAVD